MHLLIVSDGIMRFDITCWFRPLDRKKQAFFRRSYKTFFWSENQSIYIVLNFSKFYSERNAMSLFIYKQCSKFHYPMIELISIIYKLTPQLWRKSRHNGPTSHLVINFYLKWANNSFSDQNIYQDAHLVSLFLDHSVETSKMMKHWRCRYIKVTICKSIKIVNRIRYMVLTGLNY